MRIRRVSLRCILGISAVFLVLPVAVLAQAIVGTADGSNQIVVFPSPNTGLPTPAQFNVPSLPAGARPHGVGYFGSDNALVSDFGNSRVYNVQISTHTLVSTITTSPSYSGVGSIAVAPNLTAALASGGAASVAVIHAPFTAGASITTVPLTGTIAGYQTEAIVFNAAGRAFVYTSSGINVLDPPYTSVAFMIPVSGNGSSGAIAITPDGNNLLITDLASGNVRIFTAPYTAGSTSVTRTVSGASQLDGIFAAPDGAHVLVISAAGSTLWSIAAPYSASSTVEAIATNAAFGSHEDVAISADSQLAILVGNGGATAATAFVRAPFTTAGATVFNVTIPGGRGNGAVRFLPPGLAPGLTISKSGPATASSGQDITYTITYGNTGTADASNVVIKEPIPAGTTFVSATGGGTFAAGVITWNIGALTAGTTGQTVSFTVHIDATGGDITNANYTIEGTGIPPIPGPPVVTSLGGQAPTPTPTVTNTPVVAVPVVPVLSGPMMVLLLAGLAIAALFLLKRSA